MHPERLQRLLKTLSKSVGDVVTELEQIRGEHDPLATYIFVARRSYANCPGSKDGKKEERAAIVSYRTASELGFPGGLQHWHALLRASPKKRRG